MKTRIIAAILGLAFGAGFGIVQSHAEGAQKVAVTVDNSAGYNIRARSVTPGGTSSWSNTMVLGSSTNLIILASQPWGRVELEYNNGLSWKSLCSEMLMPLTSGRVTAKGTLFNKSCSLSKY